MEVSILLIWLVIFLVFLIINLVERSKIFGTIAGFWFLIFAILILVTGIQVEAGANVTEANETIQIQYQYIDAILPFSTYSFIWGFILLLISIYIIYANLLK